MRWEGRRESENVRDRRGMSPAAVGGGGIAVVIALVLALFFGVDPQQFLQQVGPQGAPGAAAVAPAQVNPEEEKLVSFVKVVLADTEDVWNELLPQQAGKQYREPTLDLFRNSTNSACGRATSAVGPFYCPGDNTVYLDLGFFDEMRTKFKAPGDFACAYVIAHEVAHHVQNLLGLSTEISQLQAEAERSGDTVTAKRLSVRLELQADFLAGVWAHHAQETKQILESGDIAEAINAAQAIGDDTLQKQAQGRVVPDAFTHGSAAQRIRWFTHGLKTGKVEDLQLLFDTPYEDL